MKNQGEIYELLLLLLFYKKGIFDKKMQYAKDLNIYFL